MTPPFDLTDEILNLCSEIARWLGKYEGLKMPKPQIFLRRKNRIKSIHGSLSIEGNTLTEEQVTALFDCKRVLGPSRQILEVQNAIQAYERIHDYRVTHLNSLLEAHRILMKGLAVDAGKFRGGNVGIMKKNKVQHIAPKPDKVPHLMTDLLAFLEKEKQIHPLIRSCVFHYELEFIHPFSDGNGRMGRLWQSAILLQYHPVFEFIPVESMIREKQKAYYQALEISDRQGKSTSFITLMLQLILGSIEEFWRDLRPENPSPQTRLHAFRETFPKKLFSRKDYLQFHKDVSTATASRDLSLGVQKEILKKTGQKALTRYRFHSGKNG